jgi:predicted DNA-binding transcriptional regulator YafY
VQRDLQDLATRFPLTAQGKPLRWRWAKSVKAIQLPGLDLTGATIWALVELHLQSLLPPGLLDELRPNFAAASKVLGSVRSGRGAWPSRIAQVTSGYPLKPPPINADIYSAVAECVMHRRRFRAMYRARFEKVAKPITVNPLGLVLRDGTVYLVCCLWEYTNLVHLAIQRLQSIESIDHTAHDPPGFDLQSYSASPAFNYPQGGAIKLRVRFIEEAGFHLTEASLAEDQRITHAADGTYMVQATVQDTNQLRWWLLGFGEYVEVLAPASLRREFAARAKDMVATYAAG